MRAGKLDRTITILSGSMGEPDRLGNVKATWERFAEIRATVVTQSTEEFLRASGEGSETAIVFRIRFFPGLTNANRIVFEGRTFDLKETKEIGRREGLELRCQEVRS